MSEMIAYREEVSMPSKETALRYIAETLSDITTLEPPLHLLPWSGANHSIYDSIFAQCYDAGYQAARQQHPLTLRDLPDELTASPPVWVQGLGGLCSTMGYLSAGRQPITHNRLCDSVKQFFCDSALNEEMLGGFLTVRSVALPVFRRLQRDGHSAHVILLQTLLHLVAWKSGSLYARQQAQRLLWLGGVLGENGELNLLVLDKELREESVGEENLPALLIFTHFLAHFPAGPIFTD